ncbi:MAG: PAS domain-containing protein [Beijerinckiaceae bacterium]|nr:PAS domain-containing protein [Beijerinckiaceae bacterium]
MKNRNADELYRYWNELRGRRAAPERNDLDPSRFRHILPDVFVLDFDADLKPGLRLVGTRICSLFGRELTGEQLPSLFAASERNDILRLVKSLAREESAAHVGLMVTCDDGSRFPADMLLLPLRHRGVRSQRMLGLLGSSHDLPIFGAAADFLGLISVRMLDDDTMLRTPRTPSLQVGVPPADIISRKGHLVLVDGKRR